MSIIIQDHLIIGCQQRKSSIFLCNIIWKIFRFNIFSSQLISDLGIKNKINEKVSGFSDGELRKLSFLRSFAQNPKFYLIDEAFSSIDSKSCEIILRNIRNLINENKCYGAVIVSHDLNFLNDSTNKVFKLRNGAIE